MDEATAQELDEDILEISRLARRIERGEFKHPTHEQLLAQFDLPEDAPVGKRQRSGKRGPLSLDEKVVVLKRIFIDHEFQKDVAKEHRVSHFVVNRLVSQVSKSPAMLQGLLDK